jgi:hypothetical protein
VRFWLMLSSSLALGLCYLVFAFLHTGMHFYGPVVPSSSALGRPKMLVMRYGIRCTIAMTAPASLGPDLSEELFDAGYRRYRYGGNLYEMRLVRDRQVWPFRHWHALFFSNLGPILPSLPQSDAVMEVIITDWAWRDPLQVSTWTTSPAPSPSPP